LPHATRSELILIIFGLVVKLLLQLSVFMNNFLYIRFLVCVVDESAKDPVQPELRHRVEHQICGSPLVGFLGVLGRTGDWLVRSYGRRS
jgi:hypothetical protein